jgi:hypothetical protein
MAPTRGCRPSAMATLAVEWGIGWRHSSFDLCRNPGGPCRSPRHAGRAYCRGRGGASMAPSKVRKKIARQRVGRVSDAKIINFSLTNFGWRRNYWERFAATMIAGRWCPDEGQQKCPACQKRKNIGNVRKSAVANLSDAALRLKRPTGSSLRTNGQAWLRTSICASTNPMLLETGDASGCIVGTGSRKGMDLGCGGVWPSLGK